MERKIINIDVGNLTCHETEWLVHSCCHVGSVKNLKSKIYNFLLRPESKPFCLFPFLVRCPTVIEISNIVNCIP